MPDDLPVQILRVTQDSRLDPAGRVIPTVVVSFKLGDHGPFSITMDTPAFKAEAVNRAIAEIKTTLLGIGIGI